MLIWRQLVVGVAVRGQSVEKDKLILKTETHSFSYTTTCLTVMCWRRTIETPLRPSDTFMTQWCKKYFKMTSSGKVKIFIKTCRYIYIYTVVPRFHFQDVPKLPENSVLSSWEIQSPDIHSGSLLKASGCLWHFCSDCAEEIQPHTSEMSFTT